MGVRKFTVLMQDESTQYKKELSFEEGVSEIDAMEAWRLDSIENGYDVHSTHVVSEFTSEEEEFEDCPF